MNAEKTASSKLARSRIDEIQDRLDAADATIPAADRREKRWSYRRSNLTTSVEHPAGGVARVIAHARLLWSEGISVLSAGFSYPGSLFTATLTSKEGDSLSVRGTVIKCRHVEGVYHELEIKFSQRIDPHLFIEHANGGSGEASTTIELPNLRGKVLYLDDSEADGRLLAHFLRTSGIELKSVRTAEEALEYLKSFVVDIFLCDLNLGGGKDALPVVQSAKKDGFSGPIVVLTAENNPTKLAAVKAAGVEHILPKPYQQSVLVQMMVKLHQQVGAISFGEVVYSTLSDQPDAEELLAAYIPTLQQLALDLQKQMVAKDLPGVREYCLNVRGSAPGYGFPQLSVAAEDALRALDETNSVEKARPQLRTMTLMCSQIAHRKCPAVKSETDKTV